MNTPKGHETISRKNEVVERYLTNNEPIPEAMFRDTVQQCIAHGILSEDADIDPKDKRYTVSLMMRLQEQDLH